MAARRGGDSRSGSGMRREVSGSGSGSRVRRVGSGSGSEEAR